MAITYVGLAGADTTSSSSQATFPLTTTNVGDLVVLQFAVGVSSGTPDSISSISGSGVGTWAKADRAASGQNAAETWYATVTSVVSAATQTAVFSDSNHTYPEYYPMEFDAGLGSSTTWTLVTATEATGTGTTMTCGSVTSSAAGQLVTGYFSGNGSATVGSTSGFVYPAVSSFGNVACYLLDSANDTGYTPSAPQSPSDGWRAVSAIFAASAPSSPTPGLLAFC